MLGLPGFPDSTPDAGPKTLDFGPRIQKFTELSAVQSPYMHIRHTVIQSVEIAWVVLKVMGPFWLYITAPLL